VNAPVKGFCMIEELERIEPLLRCPETGKPLQRGANGFHRRDDLSFVYPIFDDKPILIDFDRSVLSKSDVLSSRAESPVNRKSYRRFGETIKRMLSPEKKSTRENIDLLLSALPPQRNSLVLVIGGGTMGQGTGALYQHPRARVVALDVYRSPNVQLIADAHDIPLCDESIDAVVVQAVLEHVLDPQRVVDEIWRILRPGGVVYAETPFMQQVHEGPYDFTRFTESGHRYLFRRFSLLRSGTSGGPGTQLAWSIDYFARSVFRSRSMGKLFKLAFSWLHLFDRIIPPDLASDGASGTFFLGRKSLETMSPREIIAFYPGAQ
jgi:SAM-dependent methyltransferase